MSPRLEGLVASAKVALAALREGIAIEKREQAEYRNLGRQDPRKVTDAEAFLAESKRACELVEIWTARGEETSRLRQAARDAVDRATDVFLKEHGLTWPKADD